jgi:hypothetical protein
MQVDGQADKKFVSLVQVAFMEKLHELNHLHADMSRDNGQVMRMLDDMEETIDDRLKQIRKVRAQVREKQKHMRRVEVKCGEFLEQLLVA